MNNFDFIIYGNTTGALVAATELGQKHKVALINPTPNWGAHFGGTKINNVSFDIGMIFFEFSTFHVQSDDLLSYNPTLRNDSARFFDIAKKYTTNIVPIVDSPIPQCTIFSTFANDIILANDLSILNLLPAETREKIKEELTEIVNRGRGPLHSSNKKKDEELFLKTSYRDVSIANHGITFHEFFIEPICKKIFNLSSSEIPSIYHRIAWAPLFYPETLLKGFEDPTAGLPPTTFEYPASGYFAACVEAFTEKVMANPNITIIRDKVTSIVSGDEYTINFADKSITGQKLVWCTDLQTLVTLTNLPASVVPFKKGSLALAFLNLDSIVLKRKFSTLYVCDVNEPMYRITNQDEMGRTSNAKSRVIVEFNADQLEKHGITDEQGLILHTSKVLQELGITDTDIHANDIVAKYFKNVINLPIAENNEIFHELHKCVLENLKNIELVGMAAGFVTTSFNDQIVHGLRLGIKYN